MRATSVYGLRGMRALLSLGVAKFAGLAEIVLWICVITAAVEIPNH